MNFNFAITLINSIYEVSKKINPNILNSIDRIIDLKYPQIIARINNYCDIAKIAICSTNGKKSIVHFLKQIFKENNQTYYSNLKNLTLNPIISSLISDIAKNKSKDETDWIKNYYLMAMSEFEIDSYLNCLNFDYLILNNIFDDHKFSLDKFEKRKKIMETIKLSPKTTLIINADDAMLFDIDEKNDKKRKKIYFGFNSIEFLNQNEEYAQKNDILKCPNCGYDLEFEKRFYSHLGYYNCICGYKRPKLDISADVKIYDSYSLLNVTYLDNSYSFKIPFGGIDNVYNALAGISLALYLNLSRKVLTNVFENYIPLKAHDEIINIKNKNIKIKIIKNPTSLTEALREIKGKKNLKILFCLNDKIEDGIDTSWIWDSNFEVFKNYEDKIYVTGSRLDDMALRLKYAGIDPGFICMDTSIKNSIQCCFWDLESNEDMLILTVPSSLNSIYTTLNNSLQ